VIDDDADSIKSNVSYKFSNHSSLPFTYIM